MKAATQTKKLQTGKGSFLHRLGRDMQRNYSLYLLVIPVILFYALFHYKPMYGLIIAFKRFNPSMGILGSPWVGLANFKQFFEGFYFARVLKNTLIISFANLIFSFPAAIILAMLLNEIKNKLFAKTVQTVTYMPHFISLVVVCGMVVDFVSYNGVINKILMLFGIEPVAFLQKPGAFVPIYVISSIWQEVGWSSIIYLAAITGINSELYEAAAIDGAGKFRQVFAVTLPGIAPTIVIMFLLSIGNIMSLGYEKIILLYNPMIYETSDVISSYVYREGLENFNFGLSTAVGLFNSIINFILVVGANKLSRTIGGTSLW